jgi:hypothetical protein
MPRKLSFSTLSFLASPVIALAKQTRKLMPASKRPVKNIPYRSALYRITISTRQHARTSERR